MSPKGASSNHSFPLAGSGSLWSPRSLGKPPRCLPADFQQKPTCGAVGLSRLSVCKLLAVWASLSGPIDPADTRSILLSRTCRAGPGLDTLSWRDIRGQCSAAAPHLLPPSQGFEAGSACCLPLTQQAELATFQRVSALESRLFSSPSSPTPQKTLIKARREVNRFHGSTMVQKAWET